MPQVAAPGAFVGALPGTRGLPPVVQQLGHEVSPMATPGQVVARVHAVEQASPASIPAPRRDGRTAQRQASGTPVPVVAALGAQGTSSSMDAMLPVAPSAAAGATASGRSGSADADAAAAGVAAPEMSPVRSLPAVSRSAIHVPDRPLTSAAAVVRQPVQRSHAGHSHSAPATSPATAGPAALPAPSGGMRRVPSSAIASSAAVPAVSRQAASGPASAPLSEASTSLPALPTGPRRGVGEPTTLPAGARPVAAPSPVVSRSTMAGPMPLASSTMRTSIQRTADDDSDAGAGEDAQVQRALAPGSGSRPALALPVLPVWRSAGDGVPGGAAGAGTSAHPAGTSAAGPDAAVQRSAAVPSVRPIAAHNPLRPALFLQREADDESDDSDAGDDVGFPSPWWTSPGAAGGAGPALPGIGDSGPAVQRSASDSAAAAGLGARPGGLRNGAGSSSWTTSSVQRATGPGATVGRMPLAGPTAASSASAATRSGVSDGLAAGATITFPQRSITSSPVVQTSPASPAPTVQRDASSAGPAAASTSSSGSGATASGATRAAPSERELDDLARQLFGRIRTRLRADLLQDREASGFTFDNV